MIKTMTYNISYEPNKTQKWTVHIKIMGSNIILTITHPLKHHPNKASISLPERSLGRRTIHQSNHTDIPTFDRWVLCDLTTVLGDFGHDLTSSVKYFLGDQLNLSFPNMKLVVHIYIYISQFLETSKFFCDLFTTNFLWENCLWMLVGATQGPCKSGHTTLFLHYAEGLAINPYDWEIWEIRTWLGVRRCSSQEYGLTIVIDFDRSRINENWIGC